MGGNAAKERRRLKRLAEQQKFNSENQGEENKKAKVDAVRVSSKKTVVSTGTSTSTSTTKEDKNNSISKQQSSPDTNTFSNKKTYHDHNGKPNPRNIQTPKGDHSKKNQLNKKSNNKTPIKAKKVKKPKHLARKLKNASDPEIISQLTTQQKALENKKLRRREKFKTKVIELVGGEKNFDSDTFDQLMEQGGGKIESIVEAVKMGCSKNIIKKKAPKLIAENKDEKMKFNDGGECIDGAEADGELSNESTNSADTVLESKEDKTTSAVDESKLDGNKVSDAESRESSSSDSEDDNLTIPSGRTRGRKRRGRQEADTKREENDKKVQQNNKEKKDGTINNNEPVTCAHNDTNKQKRRCIGRKALTDFDIGKKYTGTIVYIKPKLGLFIDINCHSDAFCHISRCKDTYVETINDDIFKVGDILEDKVRVVNIDRKAKKITVSLQSDERIADEEKSNESWTKRLMERKNANKGVFSIDIKKHERKSVGKRDERIVNDNTKAESDDVQTKFIEKNSIEEAPIVIDPVNMTPAELKRARKLQRRAERRIQKETTGISA